MREFVLHNEKENKTMHLLLAKDESTRYFRFISMQEDKLLILSEFFVNVSIALDWLDSWKQYGYDVISL